MMGNKRSFISDEMKKEVLKLRNDIESFNERLREVDKESWHAIKIFLSQDYIVYKVMSKQVMFDDAASLCGQIEADMSMCLDLKTELKEHLIEQLINFKNRAVSLRTMIDLDGRYKYKS